MTICPTCGTLNRPSARFCKRCRGLLAGGDACPHCGATLRPGAGFCARCGKRVLRCPNGHPVKQGVRFCGSCGSPLAGDQISAGMNCPVCDYANRPTARYCGKCRAALYVTLPAAGPPCPNCGTTNRLGAQHCRACGWLLAAPRYGSGELQPLTIIARRYRIMEKIAQGGMGAIYKAQDMRLHDITVALKEMSEAAIEPHDRHDVIALFKREAELLATLDHPNLVKVSDLFQEEGRHYMVMEFIDGQTLLAMLEQRNTPFPEDQVLGWAAQLCDVLDYLHAQNPKIIYRDLKPGNVMVARGSDAVKLIDFGIARFHTPGKRKDTVQIGTPGYAPPEQHGRAQTDERADIYALGAMLHHLLTLMDPTDKPFSFPPVCNCNRNVSKRVEAAIAKAVRSKPDERHQSAAEMMAALGVELPRCAEATPRPKPKVPPPQAKQPSPPKSKTPTAGTPAPGRLLLSQPSLLLGTVIRGAAAAPRSFDAIVPGGGSAQVITDRPWLHAHPSTVSQGSHEVTVTVNPDLLGLGRLQLQVKRRSDGFWSWLLYALARWAAWHARFLVPVERQHQGHVTVRLADGSEQEADVSVMVKPAPWMCYLGWGGVGLAMLGEIGAVVGLAVLLI